ncbi:MAG: ribonuclease activity regulator RraA [Anaerolineae bacterium]|nr:ribonuclease activity regulator RraA [Anaerolineae bacterium]
MMNISDIKRPSKELVKAFAEIGSATASAECSKLGVRNAHIVGPVSWTRGVVVAGPALTLQFMPKREDLYGQSEYTDPEKQLHRHVLYFAQEGDIVCVDARGDMSSGIFGEMMLTYFRGKGGAGVVINGCIRDYPKAKDLGLGLWLQGTTPNYHTQTNLMPWAVNVPIAMNNVTIMPGDIIVADDDGVAVVPIGLAEQVLEHSSHHAEWEEFSRMRLSQGGDLRKYYPLRADAEEEYQAWRKAQGGH